jgi:hypothetical protein
MSLTPDDLDAMRALIRTRNGLPPPPPKPLPLPSDTITDLASGPSAPVERASPASSPADAPAPPVVEAPCPCWRPDEQVHRLLELLMQMRALAQPDTAPASAWTPDAAAA